MRQQRRSLSGLIVGVGSITPLHRRASDFLIWSESCRGQDFSVAPALTIFPHRKLRERLPESPAPTLLHNDWRLDNMMLDSEDPGKVEAVFDWDMCTLGDPLADLGTVLASWLETGEGLEGRGVGTMPSYVPGFLSRREAVERYCRRRRIDSARVPYYFVFGLFKMGVVLQQIYHRYHLGQTQDERFAALEQVAEMLFLQAKARSEKASL